MNQNYNEIIDDQIYAEAYKAAENAFNKKYNKLKEAAKVILNMYESNYGEPDKDYEGNAFYFKARKIIQS